MSYVRDTPWRPIDTRLTGGTEVVNLKRRPRFVPRNIPVTQLRQRLSRSQGHRTAGKIRSTEKIQYSHRESNLRPTMLPHAPALEEECVKPVYEYMLYIDML